MVDPGGAVWSWTGGAAERVGKTLTDSSGSSVVLVADGASAGWVDSDRDEYVFLDQATGTFLRTPVAPGTAKNQLGLFAIDGTTAYVRDLRGAVTIDLESGDVAVIGPLEAGSEIDDVEGA